MGQDESSEGAEEEQKEIKQVPEEMLVNVQFPSMSGLRSVEEL